MHRDTPAPPWRVFPPGWGCRPPAGSRLAVAAAASLLGEAAIHTAALPAHLREWWAAGVFFGLLAVLEVGLAAGLLVRASRRLWLAAGVVSLATMALWAASRLWGMPLGPQAFRPEAIRWADYLCTWLEAATVAAAGLGAFPDLVPRGLGGVAAPAGRGGHRVAIPAVLEVILVTVVLTSIAVWSAVHPAPSMARRAPASAGHLMAPAVPAAP